MGCRKGKQPTEKNAQYWEVFQKYYLPYLYIKMHMKRSVRIQTTAMAVGTAGERSGGGENVFVYVMAC